MRRHQCAVGKRPVAASLGGAMMAAQQTGALFAAVPALAIAAATPALGKPVSRHDELCDFLVWLHAQNGPKVAARVREHDLHPSGASPSC